MDMIIGRDANTSQLRISMGSLTKAFGNASSVPMSVSRQHCSLVAKSDGMFMLVNLKPQNDTYVNGVRVMSKVVSEKDKIEMGPDRYLLPWNYVRQFVPQTVDFQPLKQVWKVYDDRRLQLQIAERKFNAMRSATGLITMGVVALGIILPATRETPVYIGLYVFAILVALAFFVKAYLDSSKIPHRQKELNDQLQHDYVCPHCHHFLGYTSYDLLMQNTVCPYCKKKIRK